MCISFADDTVALQCMQTNDTQQGNLQGLAPNPKKALRWCLYKCLGILLK